MRGPTSWRGAGSPTLQAVAAQRAQLVTATLLRHCGQCHSGKTPPHCLGAAGRGTHATHCLTVLGHWAVGLSQCTASLPGSNGQGELLQCTASLLGSVGSATRAMHCYTAWGRRAMELLQCASPPAGGTKSRAQESVNAERANLLQCTATLPGGSGQWNSCHAPPGCLRAVSRAIPAMHSHNAWGLWAVELLRCIASLPGRSGKWNSFNELPRCRP